MYKNYTNEGGNHNNDTHTETDSDPDDGYTYNITEYPCESLAFSQLELDTCNIDLQFTYRIRNRFDEDAIIDALLDESLLDVFDDRQVRTLPKASLTQFQSTEVVDICKGKPAINKKFVVIATPLGAKQSLPYAKASVDILTP